MAVEGDWLDCPGWFADEGGVVLCEVHPGGMLLSGAARGKPRQAQQGARQDAVLAIHRGVDVLNLRGQWDFHSRLKDLQVGGTFRWIWQTAPDRRMGVTGRFLTVEAPTRLSHTEIFDDDWTTD